MNIIEKIKNSKVRGTHRIILFGVLGMLCLVGGFGLMYCASIVEDASNHVNEIAQFGMLIVEMIVVIIGFSLLIMACFFFTIIPSPKNIIVQHYPYQFQDIQHQPYQFREPQYFYRIDERSKSCKRISIKEFRRIVDGQADRR